MLTREERLSTTAFSAAFASGRVLRHPLLQLRVFFRAGLPQKTGIALPPEQVPLQPRAAFVVPKKIGKAVLRNRLRRQLREQYRLHPLRNRLAKDLGSCDLIFVVTALALKASSDELKEALSQLLRRATRAGAEFRR